MTSERRREAVEVAFATCAFVAFLVAMASISAPQLDDWYEIAWWKTHEFGVGNLLAFARYNYVNYNPRLGETLLAPSTDRASSTASSRRSRR